jgi:uncharacterized protein YyaL (SSP411 family)
MTTATSHAIRWQPWGTDAFEQAREQDKLILLDIGATWCHWCHVMDRVTYEDHELADLINDRFVAIRVDRDRRPDVDSRMQRQPALAGGNAGGWPLTAVLTPDGMVLYKATFLPPRSDPSYGAPAGLIDVLAQLDIYWRSHREEVDAAARTMHHNSELGLREAFTAPGELGRKAVDEVAAGVKDAYDSKHGGFGPAPKFYQSPAISLLLVRAWHGDAEALAMVEQTLTAIAAGGVHDHVGGGFHRYSVDDNWHVPHFEKLAADNAALAVNYLDAFALTARSDFAEVAQSTLRWIHNTLGQPRGAFGASQDADAASDDDGDYFTWTLQEVRQAAGEYADALIAYYGVGQMGHMHERPGRNVLRLAKDPHDVAHLLDKNEADASAAIRCGREALAIARSRRQAPAVDGAVFTDVNAMIAHAMLTAADRLGHDEFAQAGLRAIDYALSDLRDERGVFAHLREHDGLMSVGMLTDQAWMLRALIGALCRTGRREYLDAARQAADYVLAELVEPGRGLLTAPRTGGPAGESAQATWDDGASLNPAAVFCAALGRLGQISGEDRYIGSAGELLRSFASGAARQWGVFLAGYAMAIDEHIHRRTIVVAGEGSQEAARTILDIARRTYVPNALVLAADAANDVWDPVARDLRLDDVPQAPAAYVCQADRCLAPAHRRDELLARCRELAAE